MADQYNVIFAGETLEGKDVEGVKKSMTSFLKIDPNRTEMLFSGQTVVIKKNVDAATAAKFTKAFQSIGAVCRIEPVKAQVETQAPVEEAVPASEPPQEISDELESTGTMVQEDMIITNIENVPGKDIVEHFGLVSGSTIRAKHLGRDIMASLKNLVGGELKGYTQLLKESRQQAMERMIEQARELGANAIVNVRFSTSSVAQGAAELYAYGTAVRVR